MIRTRAFALLALLVALSGLTGLAAPARAAATTAQVTGIVRVDGIPQAGITVQSPPASGSGTWLSTTTDASGRYILSETVSTASTAATLYAEDHTPGSHVVGTTAPITLAAGGSVTQDFGLSTFDARLVATVTGVPAGTSASSVGVAAARIDADLGNDAQGAGGQFEVDGLATAGYTVDAYYGYGTPTNVYYPGTTVRSQAATLALRAGCTTSMTIDLATPRMTVTGRDCSRDPACQTARGALTAAAGVVARKSHALTKARTRLKRAKRHHASASTVKRLKKKVTKAVKAKKRATRTKASASALEQSRCH